MSKDLNEESVLCYINANDFFLKYTDFNFDNEYVFKLEKVGRDMSTKYNLHIEKRSKPMPPKGFWGENITAFNVITGSNGAGKTSFLNFIYNNISKGITSFYGEKVLYIVKKGEKYICFHNYEDLTYKIAENAKNIDFIREDEHLVTGYVTHFVNNIDLWNRIIFFSNYFGDNRFRDSSQCDFLIDVSKDKQISELWSENVGTNVSIQELYQNRRSEKVLKYTKGKELFDERVERIISKPDLIQFNLSDKIQRIDKIYPEKFNHYEWISNDRILHIIDSSELGVAPPNVISYEIAINKFTVGLMNYLLDKEIISPQINEKFVEKLSEESKQTGVQIALEILENWRNNYQEKYNSMQIYMDLEIENNELDRWINVLRFLNNEQNNSILMQQTTRSFVRRWDFDNNEDRDIVEDILRLNKNQDFVACTLTGNGKNGTYSSGEENRLRFLLALLEAEEQLKQNSKAVNNNIILLLDELDENYHPQFQIDLIENVVGLVSKILKDYKVQIIMTCNTPLEISDFPATNISYLNQGKIEDKYKRMETFGCNICQLLKNKFYINSTMGNFARKKIDTVIKALNGDDTAMSKEEIKYVISIIGEPIIKNKLEEMYLKKYQERESDLLGEYVSKMEQMLLSSKKTDEKTQAQLEEKLKEIRNLIRNIEE